MPVDTAEVVPVVDGAYLVDLRYKKMGKVQLTLVLCGGRYYHTNGHPADMEKCDRMGLTADDPRLPSDYERRIYTLCPNRDKHDSGRGQSKGPATYVNTPHAHTRRNLRCTLRL